MTTKVKVDMALLNGHDYIAIEETTGKPIGEVLGTARGIYAAAWRARVRDDPDATFDDTLNMSMADFEIVNAADTGNGDGTPKPQEGESGATPPSSPAPGG